MSRVPAPRGLLVVACENLPKSEPYAAALRAVGVGEESIRVVTPETPPDDPRALGARAAGVVLCGGPDLDPSYYGEEPREGAGLSVDPPVDRLDWELLSGAAAARTPVWAICRGMQTVNVFQGGNLWQDLGSQVDGVDEHHVGEPLDALVHAVEVVDDSDPLGEILGRGRNRVNSRHHQAVRDLGRDLKVIARAPDGLVEVLVLDSNEWWVKGVQWHPENLIAMPVQQALFREFLAAAAEAAP